MNEIDRQHIVRICREKCIEIGYSGNAFKDCVNMCIKEYLNK